MGRTRRGQHGPWSARHGGGHGARRHSEQQQVSTRCTGRVGELLGSSQQRASGRGPQRETQVQGPPCTRCSEERLLRAVPPRRPGKRGLSGRYSTVPGLPELASSQRNSTNPPDTRFTSRITVLWAVPPYVSRKVFTFTSSRCVRRRIGPFSKCQADVQVYSTRSPWRIFCETARRQSVSQSVKRVAIEKERRDEEPKESKGGI